MQAGAIHITHKPADLRQGCQPPIRMCHHLTPARNGWNSYRIAPNRRYTLVNSNEGIREGFTLRAYPVNAGCSRLLHGLAFQSISALQSDQAETPTSVALGCDAMEAS